MQIEIQGIRCLNTYRDIDMKWGIKWQVVCRGCRGELNGKRIEPESTLTGAGWKPIGKYLYCDYCIDNNKQYEEEQLEFEFKY